MGPLFVLAFWLFIALLFGGVAAGLVSVGQHRQPPQIRRRRAAVAVALPILLLLWLLPARAIWSSSGVLTGLHAPFEIGDFRSVELPNGYELGFIDGTASIYPSGGGEAVVSDVTTIAVQDAVVFGFSERGRFVFDTANPGAAHDFEALQSSVPLQRANDFETRPSNLLGVLLWNVLWLLPPFLVARHYWIIRGG